MLMTEVAANIPSKVQNYQNLPKIKGRFEQNYSELQLVLIL